MLLGAFLSSETRRSSPPNKNFGAFSIKLIQVSDIGELATDQKKMSDASAGKNIDFQVLRSFPHDVNRLINYVLWPIVALTVIYEVFIEAFNGAITDDFTTVYQALRRFLEGVPVYNENYTSVDPHYLYNPGATVLLSPLGLSSDLSTSRLVFIVFNAIAIIVSLGLLTKIFGYSLKSMVFPLAIFLAFLTEATQDTLTFSNINGLLLLALVLYIHWILNRRNILAGVAIGLAILIKPLFLPLLFIPLVRKQFSTIATAIIIPVVANIIGWLLVPGASDYIERTVPYLGITRDFSNSSIPGLFAFFQFPGWAEKVAFCFFALVVLVGLFFLLKIRNTDELLWVCTTSGLLLTGVFLLSALGQMYYSMFLFPFLFTVLLKKSTLHTPVAWLAICFFLNPFNWESEEWVLYGEWLTIFLPTAGWAMLIVAITITLILWSRDSEEPTTQAHDATAGEKQVTTA